MNSSLKEQPLMSKDQGSAFSFGAPGSSSFDYMRATKPIEMVNLENQNNLLRSTQKANAEQNTLLQSQNTRLNEQNISLRKSIVSRRSSMTPKKNKDKQSFKETPDSISKKNKLIKREYSTTQNYSQIENQLEQVLQSLASKNKVISKLQHKLKIADKVKKYSIQILEQSYKTKLQDQKQEINGLNNDILYLQYSTSKKRFKKQQNTQIQLSDQNRKLKNIIFDLNQKVQNFAQSKEHLQSIIYDLYYELETYTKEIQSIDAVMKHFSKLRQVFGQRMSRRQSML